MNLTSQTHLRKMLQVVAIAIISVGTSASVAFADFAGDTSLAIKFDPFSGSFSSSSLAGVTAVQTQNWNLTANTATGTFGTLSEDTGGVSSSTSVTGTWSSSYLDTGFQGPFGDGRNLGSAPPANAGLFYGGLGSNGTSSIITISLSGLGSEFTSNGYSLYLYSSQTNTSGRGGTFSVNGGTSFNTLNLLPATSTWTPSTSGSTQGDYVLISGLTSSSLTITGNANTIATEIQGIELVANPAATPEPTTYALLLGGVLALGFCVRRRQCNS